MIEFESEKHFKQAVFDYLADSLTIRVRLVCDGDYYNSKTVPEIVIELDGICIAEDRAYW